MSELRDTQSMRAVVHGRVQGVGFRAFVLHEALRLGVQGFVMNQRDGTVLVEMAGERLAVDQLLAKLHCGPPFSRVQRVDTQPVPVPESSGSFAIRY